jgi:hypothetical protein
MFYRFSYQGGTIEWLNMTKNEVLIFVADGLQKLVHDFRVRIQNHLATRPYLRWRPCAISRAQRNPKSTPKSIYTVAGFESPRMEVETCKIQREVLLFAKLFIWGTVTPSVSVSAIFYFSLYVNILVPKIFAALTGGVFSMQLASINGFSMLWFGQPAAGGFFLRFWVQEWISALWKHDFWM